MDGTGNENPLDKTPEASDSEVPETAATPNEVLKDSKPFEEFKKKRKWKRLIIILAILVVACAGAYIFINNRSEPVSAPSEATETPSEPSQTQTISEETKTYNSAEFFLSFEYPSDWTVTEADDGSTMTVKSPTLGLQTDAGEQPGQVKVLFRDETQKLPEFDKGNATSARDSEKITYDKPSSTQRGQTYVSFLQYAASATDGLDGIFITGDNGYTKGQAIPKADIIPIEPIISVSFISCDGGCASEPIQVSAELWDTPVGEAIQNLLKSLKIQ